MRVRKDDVVLLEGMESVESLNWLSAHPCLCRCSTLISSTGDKPPYPCAIIKEVSTQGTAQN